MKVIKIAGNCGAKTWGMPCVELMADSSLLKDGKPFFVPSFAEEFVFAPTIVLHVCRLGKNIARKFASRYYDSFTVGLAVKAKGMKGEFDGTPGALASAFDGAGILGEFMPVGESDFTVMVNGEERFAGSTGMFCLDYDSIIEYVSKYFTLKIGDYIFAGVPEVEIPMEINDVVSATINGEEVMRFRVK